ncbi:MAG: succinate dehydrogenase, hydrophobic membrane anchor protein [Bordetella sp.]|nr:MAG: succinate dehydrogenase, hydrophobic membrane anchor protein [Bordetella sp.]
MNTNGKNFGSKRLVVGAHYGVMDFIIQRLSAAILAIYTIIFSIYIVVSLPLTYEKWKNLFTFHWYFLPMGQILSFVAFCALAWHAWIGVRDIWMDYIKFLGVRLFLYTLTIFWLLSSTIYFSKILWSI